MKRIGSTVAVITATLLALTGCAGGGDPAKQLTYDQAVEQVHAYVETNKVQYSFVEHEPDDSWVGVDTTAEDLPDINKYPLSVEGSGDIVVEIFSSTEKSNASNDRWLDAMARKFNDSGINIGGEKASVSIRPIASGMALDYIKSRAYIPDAYSPANELWAPMINAAGIETEMVAQRLTGNTAGILMSDSVHDTFTKKYGTVTMPKVVEAVQAGDLRLGHTDPNQSSTGLNMLTQELQVMDSDNPLSPTAVEAFRQFQTQVPPTSPTTDELSKIAARGLADAMIMESQAFKAEPSLATGWVFTPTGVRHDSPLYALDGLSMSKSEVLEAFANFVLTDEAQQSASSFGFNQYDTYAGVTNTFSGTQLLGALDIWKENKDAGVPVVSMFVVDRSGSMTEGGKMEQAQKALRASAEYVSPGNYVGLISYSDSITVDLPIAEFNDRQRSKFVGAVNGLRSNGGTATNSALIAALDQMLKFDAGQAVKYRIILLSDGMQSGGLGLNDALEVVGGLSVPVFGISFETGSVLTDLERLAGVSESGYVITADSEDAPAKLKALARLTM